MPRLDDPRPRILVLALAAGLDTCPRPDVVVSAVPDSAKTLCRQAVKGYIGLDSCPVYVSSEAGASRRLNQPAGLSPGTSPTELEPLAPGNDQLRLFTELDLRHESPVR